MRRSLPLKIWQVSWEEWDMSRTDDPEKASIYRKKKVFFSRQGVDAHLDHLQRQFEMHQRYRPGNPDFIQNVGVYVSKLDWGVYDRR